MFDAANETKRKDKQQNQLNQKAITTAQIKKKLIIKLK